MGNLGFKVGRKIDDVDSAKGAFLWANATSYAEPLGYKGNFRFRGDLDAEFPSPNHRTRLFAFLTTFLRLAFVAIDDRDPVKDIISIRSTSSLR